MRKLLPRSSRQMVPFAAWIAAGLVLSQSAFFTAAAYSQTAAASSAADVVELPVLVTDHEHRPVDDVKLNQFKIAVNAGTPITPLNMRREMNDPIALTILIDASRDSFHDLDQLGDDFARISATAFLPGDRVNLYAVDCAVARSLSNAVPDAETLKKGVVNALAYPKLHDGKTSSACGKTLHLWDDVAIAVSALSHMPGRRVLLLITSGVDGGSKYDWKTVQQYAADQGVAIFGLRDQRQVDADTDRPTSMSATNGHTGASIVPKPGVRSASDLELLCANDGGLTLSANAMFRKDALADILFLVRSRFILTVPGSAAAPGTSHSFKVSLPRLSPYFVSATGATTPLTTP